jgi:septal ring factor EnvC (AmiA/AmiB activator)
MAPVTAAWPEPAPWEAPATTSTSSVDGSRFLTKRTLKFAIPCLVLALALVASGIYGFTTHNKLNSTKSTLAKTRTDLIGANSELHLAQGQAADLNSQLGDTKDRLSASQHRVDLQADQIQNLRTCLDGITTAIVRAGNGDTAGAFSVLDSVKPACRAAQSAIS